MPVCMGMGRAVAELVLEGKDTYSEGYVSRLSPRRFFDDAAKKGANDSNIGQTSADERDMFKEEKVCERACICICMCVCVCVCAVLVSAHVLTYAHIHTHTYIHRFVLYWCPKSYQ
jgi:hypothetical protein